MSQRAWRNKENLSLFKDVRWEDWLVFLSSCQVLSLCLARRSFVVDDEAKVDSFLIFFSFSDEKNKKLYNVLRRIDRRFCSYRWKKVNWEKDQRLFHSFSLDDEQKKQQFVTQSRSSSRSIGWFSYFWSRFIDGIRWWSDFVISKSIRTRH